MDIQKINIKFFVAHSSDIPLTAFIHVFHSWIQESDGEYCNLADYSHMAAGPGIFLVSHEANIGIDNSENRLGLLYNRKQFIPGSNREKLRLTFRSVLGICLKIEREPSLQGKFKFRSDEALLLINDRLLAPNTDETFNEIKPDLEELACNLFGETKFTLNRKLDPRERFSVRIKTPVPYDIKTLLKNLELAGENLAYADPL